MKDITGYEDKYSITEDGKVWSKERYIEGRVANNHVKGRFLVLKTDINGYIYVGLTKNAKQKLIKVHRLVAQAFIPNPQNLPQVNHLNGIKSDNRVENLEWCTSSQNQYHAVALGLIKRPKGSKSPLAKLKESDIPKIRELLSKKVSYVKIGDMFGVGATLIANIGKNKSWTHA